MANLLRVTLGIIFVFAGTSKVMAPYDFLSAVYSFGLVGPAFGYCVAWFLPWLELTIGVALLFGIVERGALVLTTALSVAFVCVKVMAVHQDRHIGCGCMLITERGLVGIQDVVYSVMLLVASSAVLFVSCRRSTVSNHQHLRSHATLEGDTRPAG